MEYVLYWRINMDLICPFINELNYSNKWSWQMQYKLSPLWQIPTYENKCH